MRREAGFTMTELGLVLAVIAVLIVGAVLGYQKIYIPSQANTYFQLVQQVVGAVDRARSDNFFAFPAASGQIRNIPAIANQLGGANALGIEGTWQYQCSAGSNRTITIVTQPFDNTTVRDLVIQKVNNSLPGWQAVARGNAVEIRRTGATCR